MKTGNSCIFRTTCTSSFGYILTEQDEKDGSFECALKVGWGVVKTQFYNNHYYQRERMRMKCNLCVSVDPSSKEQVPLFDEGLVQ